MDNKTKKLFRCVFLVGTMIVAAVLPIKGQEQPLKGFIDCFGYGYAVKISVNGTPVKAIKGDGQQASRLFAVDHPMRAQSSPDMADLFTLKEGENSITVEFQKKADSQNPLQVKLEVPDRYPQPLFHLTSSKSPSGKVEKKIIVDKKAPPTFTTLIVNDDNL